MFVGDLNSLTQADPDAPFGAPLFPPLAWFTDLPDWWEPSDHEPSVSIALEGGQAGRVAILLAPWGQPIVNGDIQRPWYPPRQEDYSSAHQPPLGTVAIDADGNAVQISTAALGLDGGHAATEGVNMRQAVEWYAHPEHVAARVQWQNHPLGIIGLGTLTSNVTRFDAIMASACDVSGDWRWQHGIGDYSLIGACLVLVPGIPKGLPRLASAAAILSMPPAQRVFMASASGDRIISRWTSVGAPVPTVASSPVMTTTVTTTTMSGAPILASVQPATEIPMQPTMADQVAVDADAAQDAEIVQRMADLEDRVAELERIIDQVGQQVMAGMVVSGLPDD